MNYTSLVLFCICILFSSCSFSQDLNLEPGLYCEPTGNIGNKPHECRRAVFDKKYKKLVLQDKQKFYVFWGYQRAWHTNADATFHTPDGTFTIKNAVGKDRPSSGFLTYIHPVTLSVPQYNIRVGYFISERWAIEVGTDHMKWVFDNSQEYEITGNYDRQVLVNGQIIDFETAQAARDASFLNFEHSDGYNYPHMSAQYNFPIFIGRNLNWSLIGEFGGGLGLFIPKTNVSIYDDGYEKRSLDNRFKLSGYGAHTDTRLKLQYKGFFIQGSARFVLGKINSAPFLGDIGHISHSPIISTQAIFGGGYKFYLGDKAKAQRAANKKRRTEKRL